MSIDSLVFLHMGGIITKDRPLYKILFAILLLKWTAPL